MQEKIATIGMLFYTMLSLSMTEEFGGLGSHIESWSSTNEWVEKVTDAMKEAVAEQARQGKIIAGKISGSKAQNNAYAKFLTFLLGQIQSNSLISILYKLFFTTKDPYHGTVYIRKSSNYPVIIGLFVPFYRDKVIEYKMTSLYNPFYDPTQTLTPTNYLLYLKKLAHAMHDNIALDQDLLLQCIMEILQEYHIVDRTALTEEKYEQIHALIKKELY